MAEAREAHDQVLGEAENFEAHNNLTDLLRQISPASRSSHSVAEASDAHDQIPENPPEVWTTKRRRRRRTEAAVAIGRPYDDGCSRV